MGLSFLNPLFFIGLAGLAVPVLVHLVQSYRGEKVRFPSLMFLDRVPFRTIRKSRLRDIWLFLMRCAALVLLVGAFARPLLGGRAAEVVAGSGARDVVILLDTSFSMGYGERWDRAVREARRAIEGLDRTDRGALVRFDEGAEVVAPFTSDRGLLRALLDALEPGERSTRFDPALDLARQLLLDSELPRREVALISDMQRNGWHNMESARLPGWIELDPVDVSEPDHTNLSVASLRLQHRYSAQGSRLTVTARIVNRGQRPSGEKRVRLELDGRERGERVVEVEEGGFASVEFEDVSIPAGEVRGTVSVDHDRLPGDDTFQFAIGAGRRLRVTLVEGPTRSGRGGLYISRALSIGERPSYELNSVAASRADAAGLASTDLLIVDSATDWVESHADAVRDFVERGGGVIVILGEAGGFDGTGPATDLVPPTAPTPLEFASQDGAALGEIDFDHPVFSVFDTPRGGDLSTARFYRYNAVGGEWGEGVVARFEDGGAALLEQRVGSGRILVWTSTLDTYWNDLALQPVFLPFVHQMARHVTDYREFREFYTVGETYQIPLQGDQLEASIRASAPSGEVLEAAVSAGEAVLALEQPGFYTLDGLPDAWSGPRVVAVNHDPAESDLTPMDPEELLLAAREPVEGAAARFVEDVGEEAAEEHQSLWWYILVGLFLLLGGETVAANRHRPAEAGTGKGGEE